MRKLKGIAFDLDGTIYEGNTAILGAKDTIQYAREQGYQIFFLTNNSTKTRKQIYERLCSMGIVCEFSEVYTSGYVAALHMMRENVSDIFVFGSTDLKTELRQMNISISDNENANNLLVGFYPAFTYEELTIAMRVALNAKRIYVCNKERNYPGEKGKLYPGCGAMVAPIEFCANRCADYVIGKPNTMMLEMICDKNALQRDEIIMVGDTYESDIEMAKNFGCKSILISSNSKKDVDTVAFIKEVREYI